jgi:predicted XRE-type DNA-binding protein
MDTDLVTESSGNVFEDLLVDRPEEALAKAEIARQIGLTLTERKLTESQAAKMLGLDEPRISALIRGRLTQFSIDQLLHFLLALGRDVDIVIRTPEKRVGRVQVVVPS